jgi:hypothetical protein
MKRKTFVTIRLKVVGSFLGLTVMKFTMTIEELGDGGYSIQSFKGTMVLVQPTTDDTDPNSNAMPVPGEVKDATVFPFPFNREYSGGSYGGHSGTRAETYNGPTVFPFPFNGEYGNDLPVEEVVGNGATAYPFPFNAEYGDDHEKAA